MKLLKQIAANLRTPEAKESESNEVLKGASIKHVCTLGGRGLATMWTKVERGMEGA